MWELQTVATWLDMLRSDISALGSDAGQMGPSVYDTAQLLLHAPSPDCGPAVNWLLSQQRPDGGWGDPAVPRARVVPTLAAALALHRNGRRITDREAVRAAISFLDRQAEHWIEPLSDDLPVGIELLIPSLLDQWAAASLPVAQEHFAELLVFGARRRRMLDGRLLPAGTRPLHSWEAFGTDPSATLLDGSNGVGHSPAATAAWLGATAGRADLAAARASARRYLDHAITQQGIPGVVPTVWPITRFEQIFGLYFLLLAGLLDHPDLQDVVQPQLDDLEHTFGPNGIGMSDWFQPDGDNTACALAVLYAAGRRPPLTALEHFAQQDGVSFCAYPGELHGAVSVTAHALHALSLAHPTQTLRMDSLLERQSSDGRWLGDKWHQSWLYTTSQVLVMLDGAHRDAIGRAIDAVLVNQHPDGGWGMHASTPEETAYGILALRAGLHYNDVVQEALACAITWLRNAYHSFQGAVPPVWLGKELFSPHRLVNIIVLAVLMQAEVGDIV
jgi:Squalene-hopene cyclase C-terminal domain/Prenyltransferase and squalene oxidase repeat